MKFKFIGLFATKQGFSLIEQLYAMLILMIAVLMVVPVLTGSLNKIKNEDLNVKATNLAQEMIESARSSSYSELANGTYTTSGPYPTPASSSLAQSFQDFKTKLSDTTYLPSGSGRMIVQPATVITTSADIKEVKVTVNWKERSQTKSFELPTYIYRVIRNY